MHRMWRLALVVCCAGVAAAGRSPHADLIEELYKDYAAARHSKDIFRDALLDVVCIML